MNRFAAVAFVFAILTVPAASFAQGSFEGPEEEEGKIGITGTIQAGPSLFLNTYDSSTLGFNVDLYPGFEFAEGLAAELNLGFHMVGADRFNGAVNVKTSYIPAFVPGLRYHLPLSRTVEPYAHVHLGIGFVKSKATGNQGQPSITDSTASFTINYGAGLDIWITSTIAASAGVTMRHYSDDLETTSILDFNAGTSLRF